MKKINDKFGIIGWLLLAALVAMGAKIGDDLLRVGASSGADIEIKMGSGSLKWDNALSRMRISDDGVGFTSFADISANEASVIENITADTSVAASSLTIDSKIADGATNPSAGSPHRVAFRDVVAADGAYNFVSQTSSLTLVVPGGATLGHSSGADGFIYVYALDNAGAMELAVSSAVKDDSVLQTSVTIDTASDDDGLYSTVGRFSVPIRLLARLVSNQVTAGTWALDVIENSPGKQTYADLTNSLNAKVSGQVANELRCHGQITNAGTPTLGQNANECIGSLVDNAVGNVNVVFSTNFSVVPNCTLSADTSATNRACHVSSVTVSGFNSRCLVPSTGTLADVNFQFNCIGKE